MSLGYAEKLSYREDLGGQLGAPEFFDGDADLDAKIAQLVSLVKDAKRIVAFTGAGISTACGIPDFRGPNGIWTLQRSKKPLPQMKTSFVAARPSYTHQALVSLLRCGKLTYIVSQNVDGLHLRSGIPRTCIAELHGNCFAERCEKCGTEYVRDFEIETVGFKHTKRRCSTPGCGGRLRDHILDWEDELPQDELALAERHAKEADLAICLGTSLQITPACNLPLLTLKAGGKMVIVNLQKTPKDRRASLVIHARCDEVMRRVLHGVDLAAEPYTRRDTVAISLKQHHPRLKPGSSSSRLPATSSSTSMGVGAGAGSTAGPEPSFGGSMSLDAAAPPGEGRGGCSSDGGEGAEAGGRAGAGDGCGAGDEGGLAAALDHQHLAAGGTHGSSSSEATSTGAAAAAAAGAAGAVAEGTTGGAGAAGEASGEGPAEEEAALLGSYSFTLAVHNQHGPQWPVPLLESVEFSFEDPQLKPCAKRAPPFTVTRTARQPGEYRATLLLRLSAHADEGRREVALPYTVRMLPPWQQGKQQRQGAGIGGGRGRRGRGQAGAGAPGSHQERQQHQEQVEVVSFVTQEVRYDAPSPQLPVSVAAEPAVLSWQGQPGEVLPGQGAVGSDGIEPAQAKRPRQE